MRDIHHTCCELLSFIVSLLFENSAAAQGTVAKEVVNCFHLSYLCSLKTAVLKRITKPTSCELLSFIVSLLFENSQHDTGCRRQGVVNCFHLSYLCSLKTATGEG